MHKVAEELDQRLKQLDPATAEHVERLVRDALALAANTGRNGARADWPAGYFDRTAGALQGEELDRPSQGVTPTRESW